MDEKKQDRARQLREKHAAKWQDPSDEGGIYRLDSSLQGKTMYEPTMLAVRPWTCGGIYDSPPKCDAEVVSYFKVMVHRFLSHAQWKKAVQAYDEVIPEKRDWLADYWQAYSKPRTKHDSWTTYGPLHVYAKYAKEARDCLETSAGLSHPHHEVRAWGPWEDLMNEKGERIFWNPRVLAEIQLHPYDPR